MFNEGESLQWQTREGDDKSLVNRPVVFRGNVRDGNCDVQFGLTPDGSGRPRLYRVPVSELHRPSGPDRPDWYVPVQTPRPAPPPTESELATKLTASRSALKAAITKRQRQREAVANATVLADHASRNLTTATAALRQFAGIDERAVDAAVAAIRFPGNGNGHDHVAQLAYRDEARHAVDVAQSAYDRLAAELATARAALGEADGLVRRGAAAVVGAVLEIACEELREMETDALRFRNELVAASQWWPDAGIGALHLAPSAQQVLASPVRHEEILGKALLNNEAAAGPWKDLYNRLVEGDAEAELRSC